MTPTALNNLGLHVADVDRSLTFYRDHVGLEQRMDTGWMDNPELANVSAMPGAQLRIVGLRLPGTEATLSLVQMRGLDRTPARPRFQDPGSTHVSLKVDDLDRALERLLAAGYPPLAEPARLQRGPTTTRLAFIPDPDGFFLELVEVGGG
jgi:catechol 2,3-dioxygenase-like lactoylglutathione lyase family enzyme